MPAGVSPAPSGQRVDHTQAMEQNYQHHYQQHCQSYQGQYNQQNDSISPSNDIDLPPRMPGATHPGSTSHLNKTDADTDTPTVPMDKTDADTLIPMLSLWSYSLSGTQEPGNQERDLIQQLFKEHAEDVAQIGNHHPLLWQLECTRRLCYKVFISHMIGFRRNTYSCDIL